MNAAFQAAALSVGSKLLPSSLSDLSNRREQGGKASADFLDFEAHSGSMQRKSREI
jgi:hypothetical protein